MGIQQILAAQRERLACYQDPNHVLQLRKRVSEVEAPRPFLRALRRAHTRWGVALIAEVKLASPTRGRFNSLFDPEELARQYEAAGAAAVSVVTQPVGFDGHPGILQRVRTSTRLPVLCKDFLLHPVQVLEARSWGADAVLLIATLLPPRRLVRMATLARSLGMQALVETSTQEDVTLVRNMGEALIGINNRCLETFEVTRNRTLQLAPQVPPSSFLVSESGIGGAGDVRDVVARGASGVLVGEHLVRSPFPGQAATKLVRACLELGEYSATQALVGSERNLST